MFPRLRQQLLAHADVVVELATLGEYGVDERGALMPIDPPVVSAAPRGRDRCRDPRAARMCATERARVVRARP
ncbi:MAG: hypothetical protein WD993_02440 [Thermoleophilaceae bacterium]